MEKASTNSIAIFIQAILRQIAYFAQPIGKKRTVFPFNMPSEIRLSYNAGSNLGATWDKKSSLISLSKLYSSKIVTPSRWRIA